MQSQPVFTPSTFSPRSVFRDAALNQQFLVEGFLHEQLLDASEVSHLLEIVGKLWKGNRASKPSSVESSYSHADTALRAEIDGEVRAVMAPKLEWLLADYTILTCGLFIKVPGAGTFGLHHHWTVLDDYRKYVVNIWCPLQLTTVDSGTLHVLPGTHKIFPEKVSFAYKSCYAPFEAELREKYSRPLPSNPGQAAMFDISLHHWSTPNNSAEPRIAVHCNCIPAEEKPIFLYFDREHPERLEVYRTNPDFYLRDLHVPTGVEMERPRGMELLGYSPNDNPAYTRAEYEEIIRNAPAVREKLYSQP